MDLGVQLTSHVGCRLDRLVRGARAVGSYQNPLNPMPSPLLLFDPTLDAPGLGGRADRQSPAGDHGGVGPTDVLHPAQMLHDPDHHRAAVDLEGRTPWRAEAGSA